MAEKHQLLQCCCFVLMTATSKVTTNGSVATFCHIWILLKTSCGCVFPLMKCSKLLQLKRVSGNERGWHVCTVETACPCLSVWLVAQTECLLSSVLLSLPVNHAWPCLYFAGPHIQDSSSFSNCCCSADGTYSIQNDIMQKPEHENV